MLEKLAEVPVSTWNYKSESEGVRHMGPMAQDLYAAFGLGDSDKTISTIDGQGIALAGIQGLYQMLREKDREIAELRRELQTIKAQLASNNQQ